MNYIIWPGFLSEVECESIIQMYSNETARLQQSRGFNDATGENTLSDYRTSKHLYIKRAEHPLIKHIEKKIAAVTGYPAVNGEDFQFAWYPAGTYYKPHHDYFHEEYDGAKRTVKSRGSNRLLTVMIYLNTLPIGAGGETRFPHMDLVVRPEMGKALIWWNMIILPDPVEQKVDPSTYHEALPPATGFEKYTLTKWIHPAPFDEEGYYQRQALAEPSVGPTRELISKPQDE